MGNLDDLNMLLGGLSDTAMGMMMPLRVLMTQVLFQKKLVGMILDGRDIGTAIARAW